MLFDDVEIINCTLATANMQLKAYLAGKTNSLRLYEILIDSWSNQVDFAHSKRFGI